MPCANRITRFLLVFFGPPEAAAAAGIGEGGAGISAAATWWATSQTSVRESLPFSLGRAQAQIGTASGVVSQLPDGRVYVNRMAMDPAAFLAGLPDARLQYAGRGRYHVVTGGTLAANAQGAPIVIEVGK